MKLGIDPTASDIHLGFAVVLRKLRQFQDLGHIAVLIIGDFTAQVGDPSGRSATRPRLTKEEVDAHAETYLEQVRRILDFDARPPRGPPQRRVARPPWTWRTCCASPPAPPWPGCSSATTSPSATPAASPISLTEFLYPLLQGQDSVEVRADVELGGTDQLFNNLMGRTLQGAAGPGGPGRPHHAAARGPRRRQEDVEVARQLRRASPRRRPSSSASSCRCPTR